MVLFLKIPWLLNILNILIRIYWIFAVFNNISYKTSIHGYFVFGGSNGYATLKTWFMRKNALYCKYAIIYCNQGITRKSNLSSLIDPFWIPLNSKLYIDTGKHTDVIRSTVKYCKFIVYTAKYHFWEKHHILLNSATQNTYVPQVSCWCNFAFRFYWAYWNEL